MIVHSKLLAELMELTAASGEIAFADGFFWLELLLTALFGVYWLFRLSQCLGLYEPLFIIPLMQTGFIVFGAIAGGIFYKEFDELLENELHAMPLYILGILTTIFGLTFLAATSTPATRRTAPPSPPTPPRSASRCRPPSSAWATRARPAATVAQARGDDAHLEADAAPWRRQRRREWRRRLVWRRRRSRRRRAPSASTSPRPATATARRRARAEAGDRMTLSMSSLGWRRPCVGAAPRMRVSISDGGGRLPDGLRGEHGVCSGGRVGRRCEQLCSVTRGGEGRSCLWHVNGVGRLRRRCSRARETWGVTVRSACSLARTCGRSRRWHGE